MKFLVSGEPGQPIVVLIHGMGCTGEHSFSSAVQKLERDCRVVVVSLDGYDAPGTTFSTIYDEARKIAAYLQGECGGSVHAVLGMSMGGFIALELLTNYEIRVKKLILDSGYLLPWNPVCAKLMSELVALGFRSILSGKDRLIYRAGMNYSMGNCFKRADLCAFASAETLKNSEYACLTYRLPGLDALKHLDVEYWYGEKERYMIAGMKFLKERLPELKTICVGNYGHGELMFRQPERYGEQVYDSIKRSLAN